MMKRLCTRNVTSPELIRRCHKQDVYKWSEHASHATEHLPTVNHGCPRSLLKPYSTNVNRFIHVFFSRTCVASKVAINTERGSHAMLRLVPIVLILQALLACSSRLRHHCRIPCRDGSAMPDTSLSAMLSASDGPSKKIRGFQLNQLSGRQEKGRNQRVFGWARAYPLTKDRH